MPMIGLRCARTRSTTMSAWGSQLVSAPPAEMSDQKRADVIAAFKITERDRETCVINFMVAKTRLHAVQGREAQLQGQSFFR